MLPVGVLDPAIVELDCRLKEALKLSRNKSIEQLKAKKKLVEKKEQAHSTAEQFRLLDLLELFGGKNAAQVICLEGGGHVELEEALAASPLVVSEIKLRWVHA